jgi:hypothetical protein
MPGRSRGGRWMRCRSGRDRIGASHVRAPSVRAAGRSVRSPSQHRFPLGLPVRRLVLAGVPRRDCRGSSRSSLSARRVRGRTPHSIKRNVTREFFLSHRIAAANVWNRSSLARPNSSRTSSLSESQTNARLLGLVPPDNHNTSENILSSFRRHFQNRIYRS